MSGTAANHNSNTNKAEHYNRTCWCHHSRHTDDGRCEYPYCHNDTPNKAEPCECGHEWDEHVFGDTCPCLQGDCADYTPVVTPPADTPLNTMCHWCAGIDGHHAENCDRLYEDDLDELQAQVYDHIHAAPAAEPVKVLCQFDGRCKRIGSRFAGDGHYYCDEHQPEAMLARYMASHPQPEPRTNKTASTDDQIQMGDNTPELTAESAELDEKQLRRLIGKHSYFDNGVITYRASAIASELAALLASAKAEGLVEVITAGKFNPYAGGTTEAEAFKLGVKAVCDIAQVRLAELKGDTK